MKKQILLTLVTVLSVSSAFAEREMSKLQYVVTDSCSTEEMVKTIKETANRDFNGDGITVLEESVDVDQEDKAAGVSVELTSVTAKYKEDDYQVKVDLAEKAAAEGKVGVVAPSKYSLVYVTKKGEEITSAGRIKLDVVCRVETKEKVNSDQTVTSEKVYNGQLVSFEVKPRSAKTVAKLNAKKAAKLAADKGL